MHHTGWHAFPLWGRSTREVARHVVDAGFVFCDVLPGGATPADASLSTALPGKVFASIS